MNSLKKSWHIKVTNRTRKYLDKLNLDIYENILIKMECLEYDPYKGDIRKVKGKTDIYRLRVDDFRIFYRICSRDKSIEILLIDNKAGIKERKIQRL